MNHSTASDDLAALERLYGKMLRICDDLETVADTLPKPDRRFCRRLASELDTTVAVVNRREESDLFPLLAEQAGTMITARLREEHEQDRSAAAGIVRALVSISRGRAIGSHEATGYMLRAYFLGVRRHIAFEQALLASLKSVSEPC
ncbi:hemerythrin domain-containing protein [Mesorhizobium sp. CC13]|uniref:hemerythrin domain-containing protein n=1 Tax=Mesorhizobium sp. CC13 TaxID=3029194 RepID=UPI00326557E8